MYCNIKILLTKVANQQDFFTELQKVTDFYAYDLDTSSLSVQLTNFASHFIGSSDTVILQDYLKHAVYQKVSLFLIKSLPGC